MQFDDILKENFNELMESVSDDLLISDGDGKVMRIDSKFENFYGVKETDKLIGKTVFELEEEGLFRPSVIAIVLKKKEKVTIMQKNKANRDIVVTATPVFADNGEIKFVVSYSRDITEMRQLQTKYSNLEKTLRKREAELTLLRRNNNREKDIIFRSKAMEKIMNIVNRSANVDANVLLLGDSGVGKTMLAKIIHNRSERTENAFIDINCAAIPESLIESELFGYEKGAFTGADFKGKPGLIELADGGTLFLDEISEIPIAVQAKLLKAIQDKEIKRVGGTKPINVDFRLIAATNRKLDEYVEEGKFRRDLYYRINVVNINIPSLSDRPSDIVPIMEHYVEKNNEKYGFKKSFSHKAIEMMLQYKWPGNIRELCNVIERTMVVSENDLISVEELPLEITGIKNNSKCFYDITNESLGEIIERIEGQIIREAFNKHHTTVAVAEALRISQPTAYRKIKKYIDDV